VVVIADSASPHSTERLKRLLRFLELPHRTISNVAELARGETSPVKSLALLAPLDSLFELIGKESRKHTFSFHSAFFYLSGDLHSSSKILESFGVTDPLQSLPGGDVSAMVSYPDPDFTGPLEGVRATIRAKTGDYFVRGFGAGSVTPVIHSVSGTPFFSLKDDFPLFISCSTAIVDLDEEVTGTWFDVRDHFLSSVPLMMYLKWSLRDIAWRTSEAGACFIVDDPLLRSRYGFCDFVQLDEQMQQSSFATSVAMIPWNGKRTSPSMTTLMNGSRGRLSACIHGCDHTRHEFGEHDEAKLNAKASLAVARMTAHEERTNILHDRVMVFPQGIFSSESLKALQQHQFLSAVNTDAAPVDREQKVTIRETWEIANMEHSSFPLFSRRYPSHGLENFAFDLLLGKPCLVVEHHEFFKDGHRQVIGFVNSLNSLKVNLRWRNLASVLRRAYQYRRVSEDTFEIKMFANELLLTNESVKDRRYTVRKSDKGSAGVEAIELDGNPLDWKTDGSWLTFSFILPPAREVLLQVRYRPAEPSPQIEYAFSDQLKIAARRYLSEFRDNFLSKHDSLMRAARAITASARKRNHSKCS
jgi:hypothetical protein